MTKKQVLNVIQWLLLIVFVVIFVSTSFGTLDIGPIIHGCIVAGTSGADSSQITLKPPQWLNISIVVIAFLEAIIINIRHKWSYMLSLLFCMGRMLLPLMLSVMEILCLILGDSPFLTPYPYLLCVLGCMSIISYIYTRKLAIKDSSQKSDYIMFDVDHFEENKEV